MHTFTIVPKGPFSFDQARGVFCHFRPIARHARTSDESTLRIAFPLDRTFEPVGVALRWNEGALEGRVYGTNDVDAVANQVARILSLDHDATEYPRLARRAPELAPLMEAFAGLRPVQFTSPYECAVWANVSQRISMEQAARVQNAILDAHGRPVLVDGVEVLAFPDPDRLARIRSVPGLAAPKLARLHGVAAAARDGKLDAAMLRSLGREASSPGPSAAELLLRTIPGIGPFWSSGIYLRACGIVDAFPDEPLSIAALGAIHGKGDRPTDVRALTDRYRPFRMWICFLLRVAANRGVVAGVAGREGTIRRNARDGARRGEKASQRRATA